MSNLGNIIGGHKATLHNPNVSDEAKEHSREVLENEFGVTETTAQAGAATTATTHTDDGKNTANVIGGLKAAMHNPHVSDEAKEHSREVLKNEFGINEKGADGKNPDNVARGLKAAMHNPNVSDETKQSAEERLAEMK